MDYCHVLEGNTRDVCAVEAESKRKVDLANLEAAFRPSFESTQAAAATTVDATYAVALKRCNDKSAADKAACLGEAQSERRIARANAVILEDNVQPARGPRTRSSGAGKPPKRADHRQKP
ncbi:MAG: hypothetical protein IPK20_16455 [Betaproteobacteria bacterium]|nr:hypothetical protein [Betaproteobacteria bacterium]